MIGDKEVVERTVIKEVELDVGDDGVIRTIYKDELNQFAEDIKGEISTVCRASNVEWETIEKPVNARFPGTKGWSVRAVHDNNLAIRIKSSYVMGGGYLDDFVCSRDESLAIALFATREAAINQEVKFFFELLPPKEKR